MMDVNLYDILKQVRDMYQSVQLAEDTIISQLNAVFGKNIDDIHLSFVESSIQCDSEGSTLAEVITGYLNYGEGNLSEIVKLIEGKLNNQNEV